MAPPCLALPPQAAKWMYLAGFLAQSVAMWLLRDYGGRVLRYVGPLAACTQGAGGLPASAAAEAACVGKGAVLRLAWGGVLFFGAHALLTLGVTRANNPRRFFHSGCPPLQIGAWAALCASAFAIPNRVFVGFGQVRERRERRVGVVWFAHLSPTLSLFLYLKKKKTGRPSPGLHLWPQ